MNQTLHTIFLLFILFLLVLTLLMLVLIVNKLIRRIIDKKNLFTKNFLLTFLFVEVILSICIYNLRYNLEVQPREIFNQAVNSPNRKYTIKTYYNISHLLADDYAIAEVIDNKTNQKRTIYYNRRDSNPYVEWLSNDIVKIGDVKINIKKKEKYDYRDDNKKFYETPKQQN